ncbi:hypothetical protein G7062_03055 [Erysipelothrix sp. HDW6C]|uniref:toxin Cry1Ac domain D-VI-related protein n=1 Tax=Erysipelothrix sp. HDW6C TaxID=2714930 RepID=UPI00140C2438|nr:toxin Cry1Ac domain D-VI-related protein [Erysipelothrix sp. HDW6C]QIK69334.1 hypothetical protein G7062_03055 [Erysipelothrix sp. HDW6C]
MTSFLNRRFQSHGKRGIAVLLTLGMVLTTISINQFIYADTPPTHEEIHATHVHNLVAGAINTNPSFQYSDGESTISGWSIKTALVLGILPVSVKIDGTLDGRAKLNLTSVGSLVGFDTYTSTLPLSNQEESLAVEKKKVNPAIFSEPKYTFEQTISTVNNKDYVVEARVNNPSGVTLILAVDGITTIPPIIGSKVQNDTIGDVTFYERFKGTNSNSSNRTYSLTETATINNTPVTLKSVVVYEKADHDKVLLIREVLKNDDTNSHLVDKTYTSLLTSYNAIKDMDTSTVVQPSLSPELQIRIADARALMTPIISLNDRIVAMTTTTPITDVLTIKEDLRAIKTSNPKVYTELLGKITAKELDYWTANVDGLITSNGLIAAENLDIAKSLLETIQGLTGVDETKKAALVNKLSTAINATDLVNATSLVDALFKNPTQAPLVIVDGLSQTAIDTARTAVTQLPAGPAKDALATKVNDAQTQYDAKRAALINDATTKVNALFEADGITIKETLTQTEIAAAQTAVNLLDDSEVKTELQGQIDNAKEQLVQQTTLANLLGIVQDLFDSGDAINNNSYKLKNVTTARTALVQAQTELATLSASSGTARYQTIDALIKRGNDIITIEDALTTLNTAFDFTTFDTALDTLNGMKEAGHAETVNLAAMRTRLYETLTAHATTLNTDVFAYFTDTNYDDITPDLTQTKLDALKSRFADFADYQSLISPTLYTKIADTLATLQNFLDKQTLVSAFFTDATMATVKEPISESSLTSAIQTITAMDEGAMKDRLLDKLAEVSQRNTEIKDDDTMTDLSNQIKALYTDSSLTALKDTSTALSIDAIQTLIDGVTNDANKASLQTSLNHAKKLLIERTLTQEVDALFEDGVIKASVSEAALDTLLAKVSENTVINTTLKTALIDRIMGAKAQYFNIYFTNAVDAFFTDESHLAIKLPLTQAEIDALIEAIGDNEHLLTVDKETLLNNLSTATRLLTEHNLKIDVAALFDDGILVDSVTSQTLQSLDARIQLLEDGPIKTALVSQLNDARQQFTTRDIRTAIEGLFTEDNELETHVTQTTIDALQTRVENATVLSDPDRSAFIAELTRAEQLLTNRILTGDIAALFENDALKPRVTLLEINELSDRVNNLPNGNIKDLLLEQVRNAKQQYLTNQMQSDINNLYSGGALKPGVTQGYIDTLMQRLNDISDPTTRSSFQQQLDSAKAKLEQRFYNDAIKQLETQRDALFANSKKDDIAKGLTEAQINALRNDVKLLSDSPNKSALLNSLDTLSAMVTARDRANGLFTAQNTLRSDVTQSHIDAVKELIGLIPNGTLRNTLNTEIDRAQTQLNQRTNPKTPQPGTTPKPIGTLTPNTKPDTAPEKETITTPEKPDAVPVTTTKGETPPQTNAPSPFTLTIENISASPLPIALGVGGLAAFTGLLFFIVRRRHKDDNV